MLPLAKRMPLHVVGQREVPWALRSYVAGGFGPGGIDISEIGHIYGGRDARPTKPLMLFSPTGVMTFIVGNGDAEAAELEDLAYASAEATTRRAKQDRFGEYRERHGLPSKQESTALISEALREHGRDQLANPSNYGKRPPPDRSWVRRLPELGTPAAPVGFR